MLDIFWETVMNINGISQLIEFKSVTYLVQDIGKMKNFQHQPKLYRETAFILSEKFIHLLANLINIWQ